MDLFIYIFKGLECDPYDNPADFFLDKVSEAEENLKTSGPKSKIA